MTDNPIVCGNGAACEKTCPVMRMGRICPEPAELVKEVLEALQPA
ncbi:hypothetical protein SAMN05428970_1976 [Agromyces sp. CF514]|nr:hypothetical protein SAMN05428970_1976 [Agromyces sp. CF514]